MSWREFSLRMEAYKRIQARKWEQTRLVAYQIYLSTPIKGKHVSIEKFMKLPTDRKNTISNEQRNILLEAQRKALEEAKNINK